MQRMILLLTLLLVSQIGFAVKPKKQPPTLDESLTYINKTLYPTMDYFYGCSEKIEVTLSEQHQEIIISKLPVNGNGIVRTDLPPMFVYRIPVADVKSIYPYLAPHYGYVSNVGYDRIIIRTNGHAISKYGPYWDCFHQRLSTKTKLRMRDNAMLKIDDMDDSQLKHLLEAFKRTVELTRIEAQNPNPQSAPAAAADEKFENDEDEGTEF